MKPDDHMFYRDVSICFTVMCVGTLHENITIIQSLNARLNVGNMLN